MKITLMRHGKPAFDFSRRIKAGELGSLIHEYNQAKIANQPSNRAIAQAKNCKAAVCSNLPRSILSADVLMRKQVVLSSELFREAPLPYPNNGNIRLPLSAWAVLLRAAWFLGYSQNAESISATRKRAEEASRLLIQLAKEYGSILLVGHGIINHLLAKELSKQGWMSEAKSPSSRYWGFGVYEKGG